MRLAIACEIQRDSRSDEPQQGLFTFMDVDGAPDVTIVDRKGRHELLQP